MKAKILKIKSNSRFHFGKPLIDSDTSLKDTDTYLHSDVLFSALVNNLATIYHKDVVDAFVDAFETGRIKISSCFYCLETHDKSYVFLLPRPANAVNQVKIDNYDQIKKIKRVQFIDSNLLRASIENWKVDGNWALSEQNLERLNLSYKEKSEKSVSEIYGKTSGNKELRVSLFSKKFNTQVGIRNFKEETYFDNENEAKRMVSKGPYQVSYIQIADLSEIDLQVHFYFVYDIIDQAVEDSFELAVKLLEFNGIGGERSSGYGKIEAVETIENIPEIFQNKINSSNYLSISKIIPKDLEELKTFKAYSHSIRGGRQTHDAGALKNIRMINEGAILTNTVSGKLVDISPEESSNKYQRNGKAFLLPLPEPFNIN